ncbi:MAG: hypothetical protein AAGC92_16440 [Pseudomonadota bacterium]
MSDDDLRGLTDREREALRELARAYSAASWVVRNTIRAAVAVAAIIGAYNALRGAGVNVIGEIKAWLR